jgi:hypothetical protein
VGCRIETASHQELFRGDAAITVERSALALVGQALHDLGMAALGKVAAQQVMRGGGALLDGVHPVLCSPRAGH